MVYTIDLMTLLQLLREFRRTGILQAELSAGVRDLKQPCLAVIELLNGEVVTCHVKDTRGQTLFQDREAYEAVASAGKLNWVFNILAEEELPGRQGSSTRSLIGPFSRTTGPIQMSPVLPGPPEQTRIARLERIPRHRVRLTYREVNAWPRRHRQVYILIDGVRNVEKIAAMLSQPAQIVEQVLREIEATGAILLDQ